jgi:hypothetical protein
MNLKKNKLYIIMLLFSWIVNSGFSQDRSCYQYYIGSHDFNCKIQRFKDSSSNRFIETYSSNFYKSYPNLLEFNLL